MMSASTNASIFGTQTSAPVARATGATAPTWSKWVCVRRIASSWHAERVDRAEQLVGLVAGVDDQRAVRAVAADDVGVLRHRPDGEHAHVHALAAGLLASLPEAEDRRVGHEAERDVEQEHEAGQDHARGNVLLE